VALATPGGAPAYDKANKIAHGCALSSFTCVPL
jgi:hypothetical protein